LTLMTAADEATKWINRAIAIAAIIGIPCYLFATCSDKRESRDFEMKGRGMLEARGIHGELPPRAGTSFYLALYEGSDSDRQELIWQIRSYQVARKTLREAGLSESELNSIPEWELYTAMRNPNPAPELYKLAKQYN
jgi:hypothetical protein